MVAGILPHSLSSYSSSLLARSIDICDTRACKNAASAILSDLDLNVDPCSDFYQYTCGNWIRNNEIPDSEAAVGTFTNLRNQNLDVLSTMLEGTYDDILKAINKKNGDQSFLKESQINQDRENFNKMKGYYQSCIDENTIDSLGPTPIYPEISTLLGKLGVNYSDIEETFFTSDLLRQLTDTLIHLGKEGIDNLVSYSVGADDHFPDMNSISINQPSLGLPSREYYSQPEIIASYREGLVHLIYSVLGEPEEKSPLNDLRLEKLAENNLTPLRFYEVEGMVDRFIDFESHLASLTLPNDQLQNPLDLYNPMTIAELHQNYPVVDWVRFLRHFTPSNVSLPEKVIVTSPHFMKELTNWFVDSPNREDGVTTKNIREFFVIKTILANVGNIDKPTREIYRHMMSAIASGTTAPPKRTRVCVASTSNSFGQLLGRYFVMMNFGGEPQREQVAHFMDNIQLFWSKRLNNVDWLDDETRGRAVDKVNKIKHKEAYSIITPDVRSPESLASYYNAINIDKSNFYSNQKSLMNWENQKEWEKVGQKVDKDLWYMDPHEVNAYYSPNNNEIVVPAGILQSPFYHSELPQYLNYGGIGVVIGHEITHAFDNSGRLYDGDGVLNSWWTETTSKSFDARSQCFIKQYNTFSIQGPNNTTHSVNGKMTLGENLADNGGVNAALMAMKKSLEDEPEKNLALPKLEHYSPMQLFFINFGRVWCSHMRPEMAVQRVRNDVHSPAKVRVNAAVQNSPDFAEAFKCDNKQKAMNPTDKCQIW